MIEHVIRMVRLARRAFLLSRQQISSARELDLCLGVNLLQDAVEMFLLAVAEHVDAPTKKNATIDHYLESIRTKTGQALPFSARLLALNKLRVNVKHYGIVPDRTEAEAFAAVAAEFFEEVSVTLLGQSFSTISLIDLIRLEDKRELMRSAQAAYDGGRFADCLVECRKAIFLTVEFHYDVSPFAEPKTLAASFYGAFCSAPSYARSPDYIAGHVTEPTEYIVYDRQQLDLDLLKYGMDSVSFWNIWRLTPAVFQRRDSKEWLVRYEPGKVEVPDVADRAAYVLDTTTELLLAMEDSLRATRTSGYHPNTLTLADGEVQVFSHARSDAARLAVVPKALRELSAEYAVTGFDGNRYWKVGYSDGPSFVIGYILESDVSGLTSR
jgi:hypothetical protein